MWHIKDWVQKWLLRVESKTKENYALNWGLNTFSCSFPFPPVSHKVNLLNQLHESSATMNNQRTLDIIREDLTSNTMVDSEGTYWDSRHPHLFVVMGASVSWLRSLTFPINQPWFCCFSGRSCEKKDLPNSLVVVPRRFVATFNHFLRLRTHETFNRRTARTLPPVHEG